MSWIAAHWWWFPIGAGALWALDRLLLFSEAQGWIYYRKRRKQRASWVGSAVLEIAGIFNPAAKNVHSAREAPVHRMAEGDPVGPLDKGDLRIVVGPRSSTPADTLKDVGPDDERKE